MEPWSRATAVVSSPLHERSHIQSDDYEDEDRRHVEGGIEWEKPHELKSMGMPSSSLLVGY
jgi:hypothetical protein